MVLKVQQVQMKLQEFTVENNEIEPRKLENVECVDQSFQRSSGNT